MVAKEYTEKSKYYGRNDKHNSAYGGGICFSLMLLYVFTYSLPDVEPFKSRNYYISR